MKLRLNYACQWTSGMSKLRNASNAPSNRRRPDAKNSVIAKPKPETLIKASEKLISINQSLPSDKFSAGLHRVASGVYVEGEGNSPSHDRF